MLKMKNIKVEAVKLNIFIWLNRLMVFVNIFSIVYLVLINREVDNNGGLIISNILLIAIGNYVNDFFFSFMTKSRVYAEYKELLLSKDWKHTLGWLILVSLWVWLIYVTITPLI
jgi:hypothetical protein